MGKWDQKRKAWRRRTLNEATRQDDFRPAWVIIHEASQRRDERMRLFGYVKLKNGEMISISEAKSRGITDDDVLDKIAPEAERDGVDACITADGRIEHHSKGEIRAGRDYRALKILKGDVLIDRKIRGYLHPALRIRNGTRAPPIPLT